ncbi:MAG TPA: ABC transporter substrate-binding protein [Candidatus Limnocylindria bacterium]|nr:ABC transporter substrate-binding protein [Candidatus Limnocylindria bacterium]
MRRAHLRITAFMLVAVLIMAACGGSSNAPSGKVSLKIMVGGISKQIYLPNMLTEKLGYFVEQNLDVTLIDEPSGQSSELALLAGEVDAGSGSYDHAIDLQGAGKQIIDVVQLLNAPGEAVMVATAQAGTFKSAADFKGKNLGVTSIGSGTHTLINWLAVHNKVALTDIHPIPVGAGDTFIAAIKQGKIDAGMTTQPTVLRLVKSGDAKVLIDLYTPESTRAALGGDYPFISVWMKYDYVQSHKDVVQRLVNAYVKTLKWIQTHSAAEIADKLPADYYGADKQAYVDALASSMKMFSPDGVMPTGAPEFELSILQQFDDNVKGKTIDLSKTYTTEFAKNAK